MATEHGSTLKKGIPIVDFIFLLNRFSFFFSFQQQQKNSTIKWKKEKPFNVLPRLKQELSNDIKSLVRHRCVITPNGLVCFEHRIWCARFTIVVTAHF